MPLMLLKHVLIMVVGFRNLNNNKICDVMASWSSVKVETNCWSRKYQNMKPNLFEEAIQLLKKYITCKESLAPSVSSVTQVRQLLLKLKCWPTQCNKLKTQKSQKKSEL